MKVFDFGLLAIRLIAIYSFAIAISHIPISFLFSLVESDASGAIFYGLVAAGTALVVPVILWFLADILATRLVKEPDKVLFAEMKAEGLLQALLIVLGISIAISGVLSVIGSGLTVYNTSQMTNLDPKTLVEFDNSIRSSLVTSVIQLLIGLSMSLRAASLCEFLKKRGAFRLEN